MGAVVEGAGGKIMVADDDRIGRFSTTALLEAIGYQVCQAAHGGDAVELYRRGNIIAVLMNCHMPVLDGFSAARAIRAFEVENRSRRVPIIGTTGSSSRIILQIALDSGFDAMLYNPLEEPELRKTLTRLLPLEAQPPEQPPLALDFPRIPEVVALFQELVPNQVEQVIEALEKNAPEDAARFLHRLKGSCLSIGAFPMAHAVGVMSQTATEGTIKEEWVPSLRASLKQVLAALAHSL